MNYLKNGFISAFILTFIFLSSQILAQKKELKFRHFTQNEGLSSSNQNCIAEDKNGFIWVGTPDGLNKFDGYRFKVYKFDPDDSASISGNNIRRLLLDKQNRLWVGTDNGVSLYDYEKNSFYKGFKFEDSPIPYPKKVISGILQNKKGEIFIITYNGGYLYKLEENKNTFKYIHRKEKEISQAICCYLDSNDRIWIGASDGLYLYNSQTNTCSYFNQFKYISALCEDNGKLWIGTFESGIYSLNLSVNKVLQHDAQAEPAEKQINNIIKDSNGTIWFTTNRGLKYFDKKQNIFYLFFHDKHDASSLSASGALGIYADKHKNLWVGGNGGHLNVSYFNKGFKHFFQSENNTISLTKNTIQSLFQDSEGKIWAGSFHGGIDIIDTRKNSLEHLEYKSHNPGGIGDGTIFKIMEDKSHNIWIGTYRTGLQRYDAGKKTFTNYTNNPNNPRTIASNDVRDMVEDKYGNFWVIAHGKGIDYFDRAKNTFIHFEQDPNNYHNSLTGNWVYKLLLDRKGNLWVATSDGFGMMNNDRKTFKNYRNNPKNSNSLSDNFVCSIIEDKKGFIWLGTSWGLNKFDPSNEKFTLFTQKDGLANNIVKGIVEDNSGKLWISTDHGLSKFDPVNNSFKNFYTEDGLQDNEFLINSCFKSKSGEIYFGGINGFNTFFPDSIKINTTIPDIKITDFKLFYQSVVPGRKKSPLQKDIGATEKIVLAHDMSVFSFEFVALSYINSYKNEYAVKMEGFDKEWIHLGTRREVTYTNLNPGYYTFKVKACNNEGLWNEIGCSIQIRIKPPFWQTIWAYIVYFFILVFGLIAYRAFIIKKAKIRNQIEMEKIEWKNKLNLERIEAEKRHEIDTLKLKFFTNISHEFRTPLTLIISPLENIIKNGLDTSKENNMKQLKLMYKNALRLLRLINQILTIRKLESGSLKPKATENNIVLFVRDIAQSFHIHAIQRGIKFEIVSTKEEIPLWFDPEMMDKIIYNLLSNAFKFTKEGTITICINVIDHHTDLLTNTKFESSGFVEIKVTDTGIGIPLEALDHIFERFYQVENIPNSSIKGSGIGLSLVSELVELHHGRITVNSIINKGSSFRIVIPLGNSHFDKDEISNEPINYTLEYSNSDLTNIENEELYEYQAEESHKKSKTTILVVEDNSDVRFYLENELSQHYQVLNASNGKEGYEKAIEEIPDLIISDVMMPVMNGIDFCKKIKKDIHTSHIPVILLTARSGEENIIQGLETGADDYISKPFSILILKARIRSLIENRERLQERYKKEIDIDPSEIVVNSLDQQFLEKALNLVEENISNIHYTPEDFIEHMNMSKTQLYKKLKSLTGQSVSIFIRNIRIKRAAQIMKQGKFPVSEIAFMVGFNDPAYFTRCFKEYYNESPSQFAAKYSNNKI